MKTLTVLSSLRVVVGFVFVLAGIVKLTDRVSQHVHMEMRSQFVEFSSVFPLRVVGLQPHPELYLAVTGWLELVGGLLLAFGPGMLQEMSNLLLSLVMMVAIFTILKLQQPLYMCAPAAVLLALMFLLTVLGRGSKRKTQ